MVRNLILSFILLGSIFSSAVIHAEAEKEDNFEVNRINELTDAADILQLSHPKLAEGLTEMVKEELKNDKEDDEKDQIEGVNKEKEEASRAELLNEAAQVLKQGRPDLARTLLDIADHISKDINEKD